MSLIPNVSIFILTTSCIYHKTQNLNVSPLILSELSRRNYTELVYHYYFNLCVQKNKTRILWWSYSIVNDMQIDLEAVALNLGQPHSRVRSKAN